MEEGVGPVGPGPLEGTREVTMKSNLGAHCDDLSASCRLSMKLDLSLDRETVLHFFDRVRREHAGMNRFRRRHDGTLVLEEGEADPQDSVARRWLRLESGALRFGYFAPPSDEAWRGFGQSLLEYAPYFLSLSDLDMDHLEVVYAFDMEYSGNHDQLVAETLFHDHPLVGFMMSEEATHVLDCQPYVGIALSPACDIQAYLEVKSRTSTFEVRTGEYEPQILTVYLTVRKYWGGERQLPLVDAFTQLTTAADSLATRRVVPLVVNPLALAIASRP